MALKLRLLREGLSATFADCGSLQEHLVATHMNTVNGAKGNGYYCCCHLQICSLLSSGEKSGVVSTDEVSPSRGGGVSPGLESLLAVLLLPIVVLFRSTLLRLI
jgi:hypothetical protein